jgi:hypothetical protein
MQILRLLPLRHIEVAQRVPTICRVGSIPDVVQEYMGLHGNYPIVLRTALLSSCTEIS